MYGPRRKLSKRPPEHLYRNPPAPQLGCEVILIETPTVDRFDVETPVASDLESGEASALELTVNGGRMHFQVIGQFLHRQNSAVFILHRPTVLPSLFLRSPASFDSL